MFVQVEGMISNSRRQIVAVVDQINRNGIDFPPKNQTLLGDQAS